MGDITGLVAPPGGTSPIGTTTNDNAAPGVVGEFISSQVLQGAAVALTAATPANVTSINLTPGDWDVAAMVGFIAAASTNITSAAAGVGTASATLQTIANGGAQQEWGASGFVPTANAFSMGPMRTRISLSVATTVYLVAQAGFTVSTLSAFGLISARRVR